jgi:transposase
MAMKWGTRRSTIMMGFKERAFAPLVAVSLEELVPQDHFYRHLQKVLDLSFVYDVVRESYATAGRPCIDPVVFFKLQLVMFFEDIRSERLLMRQVADQLSIRWYLGYDLDEPLPDHSSLSKIRLRYGLYEKAEALYQRALAIREQIVGFQHPDTATSLYHLAVFYSSRARYEKAEPLYQRALSIRELVQGPLHPLTVSVLKDYADLLRKMKRDEAAAKLETRLKGRSVFHLVTTRDCQALCVERQPLDERRNGRLNGLGDRRERFVRGHPLFPGAAWFLLRQPVPQLPLHQLARLPDMATPLSRGGQGGRRLPKGAGGRAESPGAA